MTRAGRLAATIAATLDSGHTRMLIVFFGFQSARRASPSNARLQPRRLMIAPAAVACKPMLGSAVVYETTFGSRFETAHATSEDAR